MVKGVRGFRLVLCFLNGQPGPPGPARKNNNDFRIRIRLNNSIDFHIMIY